MTNNSNTPSTMGMQTVVLKVQLHCDGCERRVKKAIWRLKGIASVDVDNNRERIMVTGFLDPAKVLKAVKKTGKPVEIWKYQAGNKNLYASQPVTGIPFSTTLSSKGNKGNNKQQQKQFIEDRSSHPQPDYLSDFDSDSDFHQKHELYSTPKSQKSDFYTDFKSPKSAQKSALKSPKNHQSYDSYPGFVSSKNHSSDFYTTPKSPSSDFYNTKNQKGEFYSGKNQTQKGEFYSGKNQNQKGEFYSGKNQNQKGEFYSGKNQEDDFYSPKNQKGEFFSGKNQKGEFFSGKNQKDDFYSPKNQKSEFYTATKSQKSGSYNDSKSSKNQKGGGSYNDFKPTKNQKSGGFYSEYKSPKNKKAECHSESCSGSGSSSEEEDEDSGYENQKPNNYNVVKNGNKKAGGYEKSTYASSTYENEHKGNKGGGYQKSGYTSGDEHKVQKKSKMPQKYVTFEDEYHQPKYRPPPERDYEQKFYPTYGHEQNQYYPVYHVEQSYRLPPRISLYWIL